ncbi:MAG: NADH-quinone oxidoreductase subunit J [Candidatus Omnitrophica bacterium]|nr:NADH-quinone oxidoreductase subunit J [Candidatus Omnitrophota bacterium]
MEIILAISKIGIYAIFGITILGAIFAVTLRNIFHAALGLVLALLGVAAVYFSMEAEFLGAIQILLYVGGIMTLIIFVVMLTSRIGDRTVPTSNHQRYPALVGILFLIAFLIRLVRETPWQLKAELSTIDAITIGKEFMGAYVLPFEITSLVLVVALIGAIVIARSDLKK